MNHKGKWRPRFVVAVGAAIFALSCLTGCLPSVEDLQAVEYAPLSAGDWELSTPEAQGLDPMLVAALYYNAVRLDTIHSLLVIKDGVLIAEDYFHEGAIGRKDRLQSVTKSFTGMLVGIAIDQDPLDGADQKMLDFFPEITGQITDRRKTQITIRQLLEMRSSYPWEESHEGLWAGLLSGYYVPLIEEFPSFLKTACGMGRRSSPDGGFGSHYERSPRMPGMM